jgi:hypothetical protein
MQTSSKLLLIAGLFAGSVPAFGEGTAATVAYPDAFGLDINWATASTYNAVTFGVETPALYTTAHGVGLKSELAVTLVDIPNIDTDKDGKFQDLSSSLFSLTAQVDQPAYGSTVRSFQEVGLVYLAPAKKLSKDSSTGLIAGFGFEVPVSPLSEGHTVATYYVKADWLMGLGRAKALPGEPDLFNGNNVNVGVKLYF